MLKIKQINGLASILIFGLIASAQACANNSTCNGTKTNNEITTVTPKPIIKENSPNDTKLGAASSENRHVIEGLGAYSKFNTATDGGFQPSPFIGLVAPVPPDSRSRDVIGFGEAIPVPIPENHRGTYGKQRLFPYRGYPAKPLPLVHGIQLQEDIELSSSSHQFEIPEAHSPLHQEQHHQIPGHDAPDISVQGEISVHPEPAIHTGYPGGSPVSSHSSDIPQRHPSHSFKVPSYASHDIYSFHTAEQPSAKPDLPYAHHHPPVIFPEDYKFGKETYTGQLAYPLPTDSKPVEEEQHDDGLPSHVDAHTPALKGHHTFPQHNSFLHKLSPWKGVIKILATLVPLGLLVAALQPSVVIVNATEPPLRPIAGLPVVPTKFRAMGAELVARGDGEACDKRQLCDALVASATTPANLQLAYVALASRLKREQKKTLDEIMEKVSGRNCKYYSCVSLLGAPTPGTGR